MQAPAVKVNINLRVLPSYHAHFELKGSEEVRESVADEPAIYDEPKTTNQQIIAINFNGGQYRTPTTTGGIF